ARAGLAVASFLALVPFAANFKAASRRHGPDATAARDFAYNLVQSVEPYGVLFAYGDNDTFPVWYLQEVEGMRQDVTLINLSLANLDCHLTQLAARPLRRVVGARLVARPRSPSRVSGAGFQGRPACRYDAPVPARRSGDDGGFHTDPRARRFRVLVGQVVRTGHARTRARRPTGRHVVLG